jgi:hypothetical protein
MPGPASHGILGTLWLLNFVLLVLLVVPIPDGDALLVALGLWAVPTGFLLLLTWRNRRRSRESDTIHPMAHGRSPRL